MVRRQSIYVDGFAHVNPVPAACRVGNVLFTGAIHGGGRGDDPAEFPADFQTQCATMFARVGDIVTEAGGSMDDIVKFSVRMADATTRTALNEQWEVLFPDPGSRPARQVTVGTTRPHIQVQCEFVAVVDAGSADGGNDA